MRGRIPGASALLLGVAVSLVMCGYQFGTGNHTVYLIAPLREVDPALLQNDWWTTHTLQYHWAFTKVAAGLMRVGWIEPVFLTLYLGLMVLLHAGWLRAVRVMGFDERAYVLSVLIYYLSAGGFGLGSYRYLQDGSFLPGNVANVAMLWGIVFWMEKKEWRGAIAFGVAAFFHLNHALVGVGFWGVVVLSRLWRNENWRQPALGMVVVLLAGLVNILPALRRVLSGEAKLPLGEFVDLYVHLRHPHHYDPMAWPAVVWVAFLWVMPMAFWAWRRHAGETPLKRAALIFLFFMTLQLVAVIFAGAFFVSESLIQMSLFRFSIYPKLLACIAAAGWVMDLRAERRRTVTAVLLALPAVLLLALGLVAVAATPVVSAFVQANLLTMLLFIGLTVTIVWVVVRERKLKWGGAIVAGLVVGVVFIGWRGTLGLRLSLPDNEDADYVMVCEWAREHTPVDAVFVVPPNEQLFRFRARRAIVVNFKNVPQLSSEMEEWKERMEAVLDERLADLPRRYDLAHEAMASRYDTVSFAHLAAVARRYGARYLVAARSYAGQPAIFETGRYHLYDLGAR